MIFASKLSLDSPIDISNAIQMQQLCLFKSTNSLFHLNQVWLGPSVTYIKKKDKSKENEEAPNTRNKVACLEQSD